MTIREYKKAESLEEAWQLNQKKTNRVLGGMIWLKMEKINVGTAIDLSGLGLDTIEETDEGFSIGAMVTLRQLELHPGLAAYTDGAVRESVRHIVGVQLRNLATVGGSIYSRFGFSDVLTMFLALNASVELYKGGIVPLAEYAQRPYDRDILVRVIVPKEDAKFCYQSVRNSQTDIPVLTCAAAKNAAGEYPLCHRGPPGQSRALYPAGRCRGDAGAHERPVCCLHPEQDQDREQHARQCGIPQPSGRCAGQARRQAAGLREETTILCRSTLS